MSSWRIPDEIMTNRHQEGFANEDARTAMNRLSAAQPISTLDSGLQFEHQRQEGEASSGNPVAVGLPPAEQGLSFLLFRVAGAEENYVLQWEVETSGGKEIKKAYVQVAEDGTGKGKVRKGTAPDVDVSLYSMVKDFDPPRFKRDPKLPEALFQDRLKGWIVEQRYPNRPDKIYTYRRKSFKSLVEVAAYILFSSTKDLILDDTYTNLPDIVELDEHDNMLHVEEPPIVEVHTSRDAEFENVYKIQDFNWHWPSARNPYYY